MVHAELNDFVARLRFGTVVCLATAMLERGVLVGFIVGYGILLCSFLFFVDDVVLWAKYFTVCLAWLRACIVCMCMLC